MDKYYDFTDFKQSLKGYGGANGSKKAIYIENEKYMLKFPAQAKRNERISYANSCISEYLGCKIYKSIGLPVQEVILGTFQTKESKKIVVACKDFTDSDIKLLDFAFIKNQIVDSIRNGYGTELQDILETFDNQTVYDKKTLEQRFWDMFIVDALIGNWDRHNGNWGFLYRESTDEMIGLAPVYDCGSCLFPQADQEIMESVLRDEKEVNLRIYEIPTSAITINNKRIRYFDFISSLENEECNKALERITPKIDMEKIGNMIQNTPFIDDLQQKFYMTILNERKRRILDFSLKKLKEQR